MPNDIANNMADTINYLEQQNTRLQRLLEQAVEDLRFESQCRNCKYHATGLDNVCRGCRGNKWVWRCADEIEKLLTD